jgi:3-oxoacyl-[acyl-carrier protein] reductase
MPLLTNHIAAITGAGSGIGRAIAEGYAREGARIVILDADPEGAKETQKSRSRRPAARPTCSCST